MSVVRHGPGCGCAVMGRRSLFGLASAGAIASGVPARAAGGSYEAMLVNCIDPRFTTSSWAWMAGRGFKDLYSQFTIAGGPIGVVSPRFQDWHGAFWDNLAITVQLHSVKRVVGLTHRDCGAAALAFPNSAKGDRAMENLDHAGALRVFAAAVRTRQPALRVDLGIMALDGSVDLVT
ncbi:MAG: hypothetical protein FJX02_13760 [Alphaproteobacteria bacterium]|nr:hypothetical protein [Alphaproteobacteria bacterium]